MKGFLKGLRYIARIFEDEKEPEIQIGVPTDVKHVAHIGWEGPSATTPSWMHEYKSDPVAESKGCSNKKEKQRNKGRRKSSTNANNSPSESPSRVGGSTRPSKLRDKGRGAGSESPQQNDQSVEKKQSRQKKSKGGRGGEPPTPSVEPVESEETDISVREVYPSEGLGSSTGR